MSRDNYNTLISSSSGDEDEKLVIDEAPPKAKRMRKSKEDSKAVGTFVNPNADSPKYKKNKPPKSVDGLTELNWQKGMDLAVQICVPLKVDVSNLTLLNDQATLDCFKKAAQAWLTEKKLFPSLTFSTQKSLITMMGRFMLDFVIRSAGLNANWNVTGCAIWEHKGLLGEGLKCLHGLVMLSKEHIIEMDVNSENGQRAIKETPQKAKITTNRWGKGVVQIINNDALCCVHDAASMSGSFSSKSCGMFFTEGAKAEQALKQIMAFQKACYPKMTTAESHLLMPVKCDCNWVNQGLPLLGRQVCKMTPFSISSANSIDSKNIDDEKLLATIENPSIMVFQCCNPVYRNTRANPQKNCDLKISAPDLMAALQLSKQMWMSIIGKPATISIPEFKWLPQLCYQSTILPTSQDDDDEALF